MSRLPRSGGAGGRWPAVLRCSSWVPLASGSAFSPKVELQHGHGGRLCLVELERVRDRSGAGLLPVGWPCSAFMTLAANLHRWRLSSSFSPFSPLLSGLSLPGIASGCWAENGGPGSVAAPCGGWLSALVLAMICGRLLLLWPSLLLALPAPLLFSFAPTALLLSVRPAALCCRCSAELLRRAGAVSGSAVLPVLGALVLSQGARAGAVRFVILHNFQGCISSIFSPICQVSNAENY